MTNAELITKIKSEIERQEKQCPLDTYEGRHKLFILGELKTFISAIESEKPTVQDEDLEEEIDRIVKCEKEFMNFQCRSQLIAYIARHFAKWGAEHFAVLKLGDEITINGYKLVYDKDENAIKIAKVEPNGSPNDLEEAAWNYQKEHTYHRYDGGGMTTEYDATPADAFIAGAKLQKEHDAELIQIAYNDGVTIGKTKQKEQMMKDFPKWLRIKTGERLPCPAYVWTIAYDNYPDCFEGRLMPNIQGVKVGRDTWYLPVDVIHNLPKED